MEKNNNVYCFKVITTIMILLHHYFCAKRYIGWYIGVEFFFIVSGYLLWNKADSIKNVREYIWERVKRLYPSYLQAVIILIIFRSITGVIRLDNLVEYIRIHYAEFFMLHLFGSPINNNFWVINDVGWYVAAMFIATVFYLFVYKILGRTAWLKWIVLSGVILFYGYSCIHLNSGMDFWAGSRYPNDSLYRAIAGMGIGVLLVEMGKAKKIVSMIQNHSVFMQIMAWMAFGFVWWFTYRVPNTTYDLIMVMLLAFVVFVAFHTKGNVLTDNVVIRYLNTVSYKVYLNQLVPLLLFIPKISQEVFFRIETVFLVVVGTFLFGLLLYEMGRLFSYIRHRVFRF